MSVTYDRTIARITWLNGAASITRAIELAGGRMRNGGGRADCPICSIGDLFEDGQRSMQVHDSNTAWCYGCEKNYDPVGLWAAYTDATCGKAAIALARELGLRPKAGELKALMDGAPVEAEPAGPDHRALIHALLNAAEDMAGDRYLWDRDEARPAAAILTMGSPPGIGRLLVKCCQLARQAQTEDDARRWLAAAKKAMERFLNGVPR
jgi:hypothetical protein